MSDSPAPSVNGHRRSRGDWGALFNPRQGRAEGVPLYDKLTHEPIFPLVFQTKGLDYGMAWEVFNTHYLQRGKYDPKQALMQVEHYGLWMHLQFLAKHREKFYAADLAANMGRNKQTVYRHLDRLENLRLIQRIRNGGSRDRFVSVLIHAPLAPKKLDFAGAELMQRVIDNAVDKERKAAGAGRWPLLIWDQEIVCRHLAGDAKIVKAVGQMQDAISVVARRLAEPGYGGYDDPPFEVLVQRQCEGWNQPFNIRLFNTAMTWRRLNAKPKKDAPL